MLSLYCYCYAAAYYAINLDWEVYSDWFRCVVCVCARCFFSHVAYIVLFARRLSFVLRQKPFSLYSP